MGRDQPLNARRVAALGLGVELSPTAAAHTIGVAVRTVLGDQGFRRRAAQMADDIASYGNGAVAVEEIESLL
jgi:UDP:flavonoid glycosyltransferase YjiC (YdhE family)